MKIRIEYNAGVVEGHGLLCNGLVTFDLGDGSFYQFDSAVEVFGGFTLAEGIAHGSITAFSREDAHYLLRLQKAAQDFLADNGEWCFVCTVMHVGEQSSWPCYAPTRMRKAR